MTLHIPIWVLAPLGILALFGIGYICGMATHDMTEEFMDMTIADFKAWRKRMCYLLNKEEPNDL